MNISWDIDGFYETDDKGDYVRLILNMPLPFCLYKALHLAILAKLLGVPKYDDGSGYDFSKFRTQP